MNEFKVTFTGPSGVGAKSSLIDRIMSNKFDENIVSTNGGSCVSKIIKTSYGEINLILWDTAGQKKFSSLIRIFCKDSDCIVFGYGVDSKRSLDEIEYYYQLIYEELGNLPLFYLVGNRIDLSSHREVTKEEGENYAKKYNMKYYEVSAKTGEGVNELIEDISNSLIKSKIKEIKKKINILKKIKNYIIIIIIRKI